MQRFVLPTLLLLLGSTLASADVIHLNNGRTLEGTVVKRAKGLVHLKVPGGKLAIPESTVKRVEERRTPQEEYALRSQRTDMSSPVAVRSLAHWASKRGLGSRAVSLREQAKGLELAARVDAVRSSTHAQPFYELYEWALRKRYSTQVQGWLLEQAVERDPRHARAQDRLAGLRAAEARAGREPEPAEPDPKREAIVALEEELSAQRSESDKLRARLEELEQATHRRELEHLQHRETVRRRNRVRRRRNRVVVPVPLEETPVRPVYPRRPMNLHHTNPRRALKAPRANHAPVRLKFD